MRSISANARLLNLPRRRSSRKRSEWFAREISKGHNVSNTDTREALFVGVVRPASSFWHTRSGQIKAPSEAPSPEEAFQSAETFQVAGDYEKAAAAYREAVSGALQQLGNLRVSHKEFAEGIDLLARAVQAAPARVTARVDLTIAHFEARDFDKAKTEIETALQKEPGNASALNLAGKIYFMKGDFGAAANRLESALRLQPDFDTGYLLALADLELKNPVPAGVIFDEMQASSLPSASMHVLIGLAYRETGYLDQAAIHFAKAIELEPKKPRVHS